MGRNGTIRPLTIGDLIKQQLPNLAKRVPMEDAGLRPIYAQPQEPKLSEAEKRRMLLDRENRTHALGLKVGLSEKDFKEFFRACLDGTDEMIRWPLSKKVAWLTKQAPQKALELGASFKANGTAWSTKMPRLKLEAHINAFFRELRATKKK